MQEFLTFHEIVAKAEPRRTAMLNLFICRSFGNLHWRKEIFQCMWPDFVNEIKIEMENNYQTERKGVVVVVLVIVVAVAVDERNIFIDVQV